VTAEREAQVWCPSCLEIKGEILRIPTGSDGVYQHRTNPDPLPKKCECGTTIERVR
jgi:hypothetical protein